MSRITGKSQSDTHNLEGLNAVSARAVNVDVHQKHCLHIAKALRGMNVSDAITYLEDVIAEKSNSLHSTYKKRPW